MSDHEKIASDYIGEVSSSWYVREGSLMRNFSRNPIEKGWRQHTMPASDSPIKAINLTGMTYPDTLSKDNLSPPTASTVYFMLHRVNTFIIDSRRFIAAGSGLSRWLSASACANRTSLEMNQGDLGIRGRAVFREEQDDDDEEHPEGDDDTEVLLKVKVRVWLLWTLGEKHTYPSEIVVAIVAH